MQETLTLICELSELQLILERQILHFTRVYLHYSTICTIGM